jgi:Uma2 family endonuclease
METTRERTDAYTEYEDERQKPVPGVNHSRLQIRLSVALFRHEPEYTVLSELALKLDGDRFTPDLCVYPPLDVDYQRDTVRMSEPPLLAVEIVSPSQSTQDVVDRITDMLDAGVQSCWLVQPAMQTVTIYTPGARPTTVSSGTVTDPATDIAVDVADIFDEGAS